MRPNILRNNVLRLLYFRYKNYIIPFSIILACIALFFLVIIPQIQNIIIKKSQADSVQQRLTQLTINLNSITSTNQQALDTNLQIVSAAFPPDKDFIHVLNAITAASQTSSILLGNYTFSIGSLTVPTATKEKQSSLHIVLAVKGTIGQIGVFLDRLNNLLPLSNVSSVTFRNDSATIEIDFYYEPFVQLVISDDTPVVTPTQKQNQLMQALHSWQPTASSQ